MVLDRGSLKRESKVLLKTAQVSPYLFTLVLLAIMFVINGISDYVQMDDEFAYVYSLRFDMDLSFLALHRAFPAFAVWFVTIVCTLLGVVLTVGASLYHLGIRRGEEMPFVTLFDGFAFVGKIILLYVVQVIFISLWTLLLVVPGIVAAYRAMELAIQKAKDVGIGIVNVHNSNHCSCTAYYIRMAAKENMLAIVSSNAPKSMAPWGSREKYLGTNPLAVGAPTHGDPVMIDMATSVVARGKIILADKKGDSIPEGWAIDVDGHPTTDAAKALEGCVLPFGGAKGSGIAMMIDVFSGVLSGAAYGSHIHNPFAHPEVPMDTGHCMIAIDISRFQDPEEFKTTMDTYRSEVKGLKPAAGVEEIFMPGEIECNNYRKNLEAGPQLSLAVYRELEGLCEKLRIPFDILKK